MFKNNHNLITIVEYVDNYDHHKIIQWCNNFGCVVGDVYIDGRIYPGKFFKMQFPKHLIEKHKKIMENKDG